MSDLISREALKEDFKSRLALCNEWIAKAKDKETKIRASAVKAFIVEVIMTIDNAPTVDIKDEIAGAYNEGYMCGNKEAEKGRPQGEWNKCDYYSFSQAFINGIVEVISKYGITTVDELLEYLKGGAE